MIFEAANPYICLASWSRPRAPATAVWSSSSASGPRLHGPRRPLTLPATSTLLLGQ